MNDTVFSVSELNRVAKNALERGFSGVIVEGEISDLLQHRSGHWYFTLKDDRAQLRAAMFRSSNQRVAFKPESGQQVQVTGRLSIYEPRGSYQFIAEQMAPAGHGKLQIAFEKLKIKLAAEGLFDAAAKQALPAHPRQVAIITSPQGAALHDMQSTFARRFAGIELVVIPVAVQGAGAAAEIAAAIALANRLAQEHRHGLQPDAIIVGRGGGSLEDLWSFNEAEVAYAIFNSKLPVVSAVGHETDFTIADFVADARAATPTAAAELLSPYRIDLLRSVQVVTARLLRAMRNQVAYSGSQLGHLRARLKHPGDRLQQQAQLLDQLDMRLCRAMLQTLAHNHATLAQRQQALSHHSPAAYIGGARSQLSALQKRLGLAASRAFESRRQRGEQLAAALHIVSPLATLQRGYAIVKDEQDMVLRSVAQAAPGERISAQLHDGKLLCRVDETSDETLLTKERSHD